MFRWTKTLVDHGVITDFDGVMYLISTRPSKKSSVIAMGNWQQKLSRNNLGATMVRFRHVEQGNRLRWVLEVFLPTVGKCSYKFVVSALLTVLNDPNESSSVLHCVCVRCLFSHEDQPSCAEITAAVIRLSQESMSQRERLLVPSQVSSWLKWWVGNSRALEEEYLSVWRACIFAQYLYFSLLKRFSPKQKKVRAKTHTELTSGVFLEAEGTTEEGTISSRICSARTFW